MYIRLNYVVVVKFELGPPTIIYRFGTKVEICFTHNYADNVLQISFQLTKGGFMDYVELHVVKITFYNNGLKYVNKQKLIISK